MNSMETLYYLNLLAEINDPKRLLKFIQILQKKGAPSEVIATALNKFGSLDPESMAELENNDAK